MQIDSESAEAAEVLGHVYYASGYGLAGAAPGKKMVRTGASTRRQNAYIHTYFSCMQAYFILPSAYCRYDLLISPWKCAGTAG